LSSVADNPCKVGFEAAGLLDRLMAGAVASCDVEPTLIPPLGVVTRRSTDVTVTDDPLVRDALRFLREHACEDINVTTVLRQIRLSRSAFYRRFRRAVGRPLHEEILRARLDRVKYLATQTLLPLTRIARLAGFEHAEYMGAVFKRALGITPGEYRARHRPRTTGKD
jgi:LacI family transcriptional regulator